jgi:ferredoxin-NADP reductase
MPAVTTRLRRREVVAEQTMAFFLEKPEGFRFLPGQTIDLTLIDPPESDFEGDTRTFSIASAPHEPEIMVATRMRGSAFKRVLAEMAIGSPVQLEEPIGTFTLERDKIRPAVFLAGGIGVTPFRSMMIDRRARGAGAPMWLFYSNHRPEQAAFLHELQDLALPASALHLVSTITSRDPVPSWQGERGRITLDMLRRHIRGDGAPVYYIAGPPTMVATLHDALVASGISKSDVRVEEFAGYV